MILFFDLVKRTFTLIPHVDYVALSCAAAICPFMTGKGKRPRSKICLSRTKRAKVNENETFGVENDDTVESETKSITSKNEEYTGIKPKNCSSEHCMLAQQQERCSGACESSDLCESRFDDNKAHELEHDIRVPETKGKRHTSSDFCTDLNPKFKRICQAISSKASDIQDGGNGGKAEKVLTKTKTNKHLTKKLVCKSKDQNNCKVREVNPEDSGQDHSPCNYENDCLAVESEKSECFPDNLIMAGLKEQTSRVEECNLHSRSLASSVCEKLKSEDDLCERNQQCPVCCLLFTPSKSMEFVNKHIRICLIEETKNNHIFCARDKNEKTGTPHGSPVEQLASGRKEDFQSGELKDEMFFCQICQKDLSRMNSQRRTQHMNRCCDKAEEKNQTAHDGTLAQTTTQLNCPICGKPLKSSQVRSFNIFNCMH